ncbi:MAG: polymer-forming cytoskeletal protein [Lachnospiraceae bacterium]|jgi:cytoskeletal protein CcmA (bactofilin family)|nr:polymer-forming cytoskeletal protein [Lachnospiraceae bacterium]
MKKNRDKSQIKITTILGKEAEFQGDFHVKGSARVDGTVNGNVVVTGSMVVGTSGYINGNIDANTAIIGGEVFGNVTAAQRLELTGTAKVIGDISTKIIVIDGNAVFHGRCDMNQEATPSGEKRNLSAKNARIGKKSAKAALQEALREVEEDVKNEEATTTEG